MNNTRDKKEKGLGKKELQRIGNVRMEGYGIRLNEKAYVNALLRHDGRIVSAYKDAFPDEEICEATMLKRGKIIINRGRVREYIKEVMMSKEISPEWTIGQIAEIAKNGEREADKLKALEMLGKFQKMFKTDVGSSKTTYNLNIHEDTARRLLERRAKHEIGGGGDFIDVVNGAGDTGSVIDGEEESD